MGLARYSRFWLLLFIVTWVMSGTGSAAFGNGPEPKDEVDAVPEDVRLEHRSKARQVVEQAQQAKKANLLEGEGQGDAHLQVSKQVLVRRQKFLEGPRTEKTTVKGIDGKEEEVSDASSKQFKPEELRSAACNRFARSVEAVSGIPVVRATYDGKEDVCRVTDEQGHETSARFIQTRPAQTSGGGVR